MDTARWMRVRELLERALDVEDAERDAWLARACGSDAELLREVTSLLANDSLTSPLEPPDPQAVTRALGDGSVGTRVGPYEIARRIGEGGMGAVYLARRVDSDFEQEVAIKLIKRGMDTDDILRQFHRERAVLSTLQHEGIARLFDGGATEDGRPWFAMEHIAGEPIDEWCGQHELSTDQRIALFLSVCAAVQHAHQRLIVHRDLKPSNILVTKSGTPKLLDFGIAKVLAGEVEHEPTLTLAAERRLTPDYASPEQLRGEPVTTATDVYSLGVVLCELLAGAHPFRGASDALAARATPAKPSTLVRRGDVPRSPARSPRSLDADLDTIVLTALAPETQRRYPSVDAFAADLQRYLEGLPIHARPATVGYRLRKYVARNRLAVGAAAVVAIALGVGLVLARAGYVEALAQTKLAREHAAKAERESRRANAVLDLTASMFAGASPHDVKSKDYTLRQLLDDYAPKLASEPIGDPEVEASVHRTIGVAYRQIGLIEPAGEHLSRALELRRAQLPESDAATVESRIDWLLLLHDRGEYAEAERNISQVLAEGEARHDPPLALANSLYLRGELRDHLGRTQEAEDDLRRVIATARAADPPEPQLLEVCVFGLGRLLAKLDRLDEAEALLDEALQLAREIMGPQSFEVANALDALAMIDRQRNKLDRSDERLTEALAIDVALYGPDYHGNGPMLDQLGLNQLARGNYGQAADLFERAIEISRKSFGPRHPSVAYGLSNLGSAREKQGELAAAERAFRECLSIRVEVYGEEHRDTARAMGNLAIVLQSLGKLDEAEVLCEQSLAVRRKVSGERSVPAAAALSTLSGLQMARGNLKAAEQSAREAVDIYREQPELRTEFATALSNLSSVLRLAEHYEEALAFQRESLDVQERVSGPDHPQVARALTNLAQVLLAGDRYDEAREPAERSLEIHRAKPAETRPTLARTLTNLGRIAEHDEKPEVAEELYREALTNARQVWGDRHAQSRDAATRLVGVLEKRGAHDEADDLRRELGLGPAPSVE